MPTVARLRAARKDAGNTPAMIVRMRAGNMPAALARTAAGSRAVTIASRIAVVNTTTTAATAVRRDARNTPGTTAAMAVSTGVASRAMPVGAMNATASAPIRTGRAARIAKAPVSTAAATTAISVESVMAVRAPSAAMDARARIPVRRPATAVREAGRLAHRSRRAHASPMPPFASTRCSACWARSCNGPIRRTRPCRTGCAAIPAWAPATAPKSPKPSTTCCGICGATASTVKAALARPRAVWPSWAWPPRWARRNWPKGWTRPRPNGCSACRASIRPRCRARYGAAFPTGWTSVCPPWTARTR